jgi:hypothetical protein
MYYVLLDYNNKWRKDVFRMFFYVANYLVNNLNYKIIDIGHIKTRELSTLLEDNNNQILVIENHDETLLRDFFDDIDEVKVNNSLFLYSDDIHKGVAKKKKSKYYEDFTLLFLTYYNPFFELYEEYNTPEFRPKVVWTPMCVEDSMDIDFNQVPDQKIGLFGMITQASYPNRYHLKMLARDQKYSDKIMVVEHPNKKYKPVNYSNKNLVIGENYYKLLNSLLCNFTCSLTYGFAVCKYFEIPFTGSLLLCDTTHDDLSQLGFIDGVNCLIYNSVEEIDEKVKYIFDNPHVIDEIRENGYYLIRERHLVSIRCREIYNNMKKFKK